MLKIGFMTTLGVNVGDEFIREGIRAVLDGFDVPYTPLYVNKHEAASLHRPVEDEAMLVADKYWDADLFIQAGAPVYWRLLGGKSRSVNSQWHSWLWQERILASGKRRGPVFVNLGAGSCQAWGEGSARFLEDPECRQFALDAARRAALTTVRDDVAAEILARLGVPHRAVPCPAFLAACRHRLNRPAPGLIGINLMPLSAHYDLAGNFDRNRWSRCCADLCGLLRRLGRLVFICHDDKERQFANRHAQGGERVFLAAAWRDYLDMYAACQIVLANRVHGAVVAAGFGVPSLIIGNDTRAHIGHYIGLPVYRSEGLVLDGVVSQAASLMQERGNDSERLLNLREETLREYRRLLEPILMTLRSSHARQDVAA